VILLGWHRASLERRVLRALVHRVFKLASCDVAVLVDRRGLGIMPSEGSVVVVVDSGEADESVKKVAQPVSESLHVTLRRMGMDEPVGEASVAVVTAKPPWTEEDEFGQPATAFATKAECPILVVRQT